jgi:predicted DCC family thiol-disulfide oxidoreductase YuxK
VSDVETTTETPEVTQGPGESEPSPSAARRALQVLDRAWLQADPRALGIFRIVFGLLTAYDVLRRMPYIETFYSNSGTLSNHFSLFAPHYQYNFSALFMLSTPGEVTLFFCFALFCIFCFTIGYRTTLFHALSFICILSIHTRNTMLENGGDVVMNIWWVWTFFLPLGARYSVDSLKKSLSRGNDRNPSLLSEAITGSAAPIRSLAVFMVLWQLAVIYFFNTVHKGGATWADGTAIAYTLYQDRINTPLAVWVRDNLPLIVTQLMTWGTLVIEGVAPLLLLTPLFTKWARRITLSTLASLHIGIWLLTDVGLFSPTMMVSYLILIHADDIALIRSILRRLAGHPIRVWYDDGCGLCFRLARIGARVDRLGLVEWHGSKSTVARPQGWDEARYDETTQRTLLVESVDDGKVYEELRAVARIIAALPLGRFIAWFAWVPPFSWLGDLLYRWFSGRRHRVSAWLGYGQCQLSPVEVTTGESNGTAPSTVTLRRGNFWVSTIAIAVLFSATTSQLLIENRFIKRELGWIVSQPDWAKRIVQYARIFQGWSMFAPDAPKGDGWLVIDVERPDGTHVDPQTNREPEFITATYPKMKWDQFWGSYSMRVASGRHRRYRPGIIHWLRNTKIDRLHLKEGEAIKSVVVWWIGDVSPDPRVGGPPKQTEKYVVAEWPKGHSKRAGKSSSR